MEIRKIDIVDNELFDHTAYPSGRTIIRCPLMSDKDFAEPCRTNCAWFHTEKVFITNKAYNTDCYCGEKFIGRVE